LRKVRRFMAKKYP